jgi:hypothetical protein
MVVKYFPCWYRLNAEDRYFIWVWSEQTEQTLLVVDAAGFIPSFENPLKLRDYAALNCYGLESEKPRLHDLDWVASWTVSPRKRVDCKKALNAWNLFADVAASIGDRGSAFKHLDSQLPEIIYEKLFWGNNLPSMTPKGAHYEPEWSIDEIRSIANLLGAGLQMLTSCTRPWPQKASSY